MKPTADAAAEEAKSRLERASEDLSFPPLSPLVEAGTARKAGEMEGERDCFTLRPKILEISPARRLNCLLE